MIERAGKKKMLIFSGSSNPELADKVAKELGTELAEVDKTQFANGEIYIRLQESVRGADCFVMQSHSGQVNFTIMEQLLLVDALKRASAKRITAVLPFYPYSRQDKKVGAGSVITKDVPPGVLGIERNDQKNIEGYMDRKNKKGKE